MTRGAISASQKTMSTKPGQSIRVLIVDDHPTFRMGLAALVNSQTDMKVTAECGTGEEAIEVYRTGLFDVVLMDLRLPGLGGVETTLALMSRDTGAKVVVITTYDADEDVYRALQAGAKSYLLKDMSTAQIIGTIRSVHLGTSELPSVIAQRLDARLQRQELQLRCQQERRPLHREGQCPHRARQGLWSLKSVEGEQS